ncbi:MAG: hypothetical protein ACXABO_05485 [Promethearchaeota archaeon]|jgi:hypothetical protein
MTVLDHKIAFYTTSALGLMLLFFMVSTFITFAKKRKKLTLYLALNYFSFILGMLFFAIAHYTVVQVGSTTDFYYQASMFANVFVTAGIICLTLFHGEFAEVKKRRKITEIGLGLFIIVWILLPFNYVVATSGFQLKYLTYTLMSLYGILIYISLTISFFRMSRRALKGSKERKQMLFLSVGSAIFLEYFFIITAYGILQTFIFLFIGLYSLAVSFFCYFLGIYLPKFRKTS